MAEASPMAPMRDAAVVDIGSNSVRLVVYRLEGRAIWTTYNEKVLAGLGRDLPATGRLSPEGVAAALPALRRFCAVLAGAGVDQVFTAATAAVRDAQDGPAFVARIEAETGLKVRVLSGQEEAHYSALGVVAGEPQAGGVVADLGGSSLELVRLDNGWPQTGVTLPLGPFALGSTAKGGGLAAFDPAVVRKRIAERLAPVAARFRTPELHAVGGAWRNIVLLHMRASRYPLEIVHEYELRGRGAIEAARFVAAQSRSSLERTPGVSKKRAETLPYAAAVLEALIEQLGVERLVISAFGLREGLLLESMTPEVRAQDPLVAGCQALGERQGMSERLGAALEAWLAPLANGLPALFPEPRRGVLLAAACRLADVGARLHPDHRADLAFDQVLRAPVGGQNHAERAFIAASVFSRYTSQTAVRQGSRIEQVLSPERLRRARALGAAMRLGCDLSGRSPALLAASRLTLEPDALVLTAEPDKADLLLGEQTKKRLATLAETLERRAEIRVG